MTAPPVKKHPEQRADEHWLGNVHTGFLPDPRMASLMTVRCGHQAFCINGTKLDPDEYRPLFIGVSEYEAYDRIMMDRFSRVARGLPNE